MSGLNRTLKSQRMSKGLGLFAAGLFLLPALLVGHHSISGEFDANNPIAFTGKVVRVDWLNPHIYTHIEVTEGLETGKVFKVEGSAPNSLFRRGWRKETLQVDQVVEVKGLRAHTPNSPNVGQARITTSDGIDVFAGRNDN